MATLLCELPETVSRPGGGCQMAPGLATGPRSARLRPTWPPRSRRARRGSSRSATSTARAAARSSVDGTVAYIAHMKAPHGTTHRGRERSRRARARSPTLEVPRRHALAQGARGQRPHAREPRGQPAHQPPAGIGGGLGIYDVSDPSRPREITFWQCGGAGVHRFTFDGRYAYISPEMDGYVGNIVMILDLADPARPQEVGRWWMPGQWTAGGETPTWSGRQHRCHHPIRARQPALRELLARRLRDPRHRGHGQADASSPGSTGARRSSRRPTPRCRVPFPLHGRRIMLVADEDVAKTRAGAAVLPVAGGHHRRAPPGALRELPGRRASTATRSPSSPAATSRASG